MQTELLAGIAIRIEAVSRRLADEVEANLLTALRNNVPPSDYQPTAVIARDKTDMVVGGLIGSMSYGWLLVKVLWVSETLRGRGLGTRIMATAENDARAKGCHGAWLDTSSVRAAAFYERLGYHVFGKLTNDAGERPEGHSRLFLCKRLAPYSPRLL